MFYNNNANILVRGILVRLRLKWESKYVHLSTLLVFTNKNQRQIESIGVKRNVKQHISDIIREQRCDWVVSETKQLIVFQHILLVVIWSNVTSFGPTKSNTMYIRNLFFNMWKMRVVHRFIFLEHVCIVIKNIEPF